jgi:hypothetical protein
VENSEIETTWPPKSVPFRRIGLRPATDAGERHALIVRLYELEEQAAILRARLRAGRSSS